MQTSPYSRSGLRQPITTYFEVCTMCILQYGNVLLVFLLSRSQFERELSNQKFCIVLYANHT